jgi:hypothetical protein
MVECLGQRFGTRQVSFDDLNTSIDKAWRFRMHSALPYQGGDAMACPPQFQRDFPRQPRLR